MGRSDVAAATAPTAAARAGKETSDKRPRSFPKTSLVEAEAWRGHTTGESEVLTFPGGHFLLDANHAEVVRTVTSRLLPGESRVEFPDRGITAAADAHIRIHAT